MVSDSATGADQVHRPGYTFTIFIPTYNRASLLPRALESIACQSYRDFEVLIIDDGSSDETKAVVSAWQAEHAIPVVYVWQQNQGKPAAHNAAVERARGEFIVILDSDDRLAERALEILKAHWDAIPLQDRARFAGVEGLCAELTSGQIVGDRFPQDVFDSTYLETRYRYGISGDKKNAIRTDVLQAFPFPIFPGEKHVPESLVWNRMSQRYSFRYINEIIEYVEYQRDGLSGHVSRLRRQNPQAFRLAFEELLNQHAAYCSFRQLYHAAVRYTRYSLLLQVGLGEQFRTMKHKTIWLLALPEGGLNWLKWAIKGYLSRK